MKHISSKALLLLHVVLRGCLISFLSRQPFFLSLLVPFSPSTRVPISGNTLFGVEGPQATLRGRSPSRFCDDIFNFYLLFHAVFVSKQLLDSVFDGTRCPEDFLHRLVRDNRTLKPTAFVALLARAPEGPWRIEAIGVGAAHVGIRSTFIYIYTVISAADVFQFEANVTFAVVASKCVHTSSIVGADSFARGTLVDIDAEPSVRGQAQSRGRTPTPRPSLRVFAAVLAVGHGTRPRVGTRGIGREHVATEAEALVASMCVHASVLARPGFLSTLVHILTAGFPGVSWEASTFVWSHTLTELTARLTCSFAGSLAAPPPAVAAGQFGSIATEAGLERWAPQSMTPWAGRAL